LANRISMRCISTMAIVSRWQCARSSSVRGHYSHPSHRVASGEGAKRSGVLAAREDGTVAGARWAAV